MSEHSLRYLQDKTHHSPTILFSNDLYSQTRNSYTKILNIFSTITVLRFPATLFLFASSSPPLKTRWKALALKKIKQI